MGIRYPETGQTPLLRSFGFQNVMIFRAWWPGRWQPFNPADYHPYTPRQRWYRTANDAYLTTHFHAAGTVLKRVLRNKRLSWFQLVLAGTYGGAFHPTAEGHAVIADAVLPQARAVLGKYALE